jgi:hypothetical protein
MQFDRPKPKIGASRDPFLTAFGVLARRQVPERAVRPIAIVIPPAAIPECACKPHRPADGWGVTSSRADGETGPDPAPQGHRLNDFENLLI